MLRLVVQESGCWIWTKAKHSEGYGIIRYESRNLYTHRMIYEELVGDLIPGWTVDHLCYNRLCGNPFHLKQVTNRANILRGAGPTAENARMTHCRNGHPLLPDRRCRTCRPLRRPSHLCIRGHEMTEENTYYRPDNGNRQCRKCIKIRGKR